MNQRSVITESKLIKREYRIMWSLWRQGLIELPPSPRVDRVVSLAEAGTILAVCVLGMVVIVAACWVF